MKFLRGPRVDRFLQSNGIDAKRYWLLVDLFALISERGEMMDQLGRNGVALRAASWLYFFMSGILAVLLLVARAGVTEYLAAFLGFTAFVLLTVLLSETGNSLVNPVEGLVLVHQPINGATYTAAKLTHLARIVFYLVPGINAVPAAAGLLLPGSTWFFPIWLLLGVGHRGRGIGAIGLRHVWLDDSFLSRPAVASGGPVCRRGAIRLDALAEQTR